MADTYKTILKIKRDIRKNKRNRAGLKGCLTLLMKQLKEGFGVTSIEEAEILLEGLKNEIN